MSNLLMRNSTVEAGRPSFLAAPFPPLFPVKSSGLSRWLRALPSGLAEWSCLGAYSVRASNPGVPFLTGLVQTIFDVDPKDGQRFIGSAAPDTSSLPLNVITNWTAELKKK